MPMEKLKSPVWSVPVSADGIPDKGLHIEIDATPAVRADVRALVAGLASVTDLPKLSATFDLTRRGSRVHVAGHVNARVTQTCVVTLEPIETEVSEAVDLVFVPVEPGEQQPKTAVYDNNTVDSRDEFEPLVEGTVDLGALATEFLVLGVDPHPRKPGAEFPPFKVGDDETSAFAALAALKKRLGGGTP
jgi:uncharacterized metal-binding protein YceD (DUF177 family)